MFSGVSPLKLHGLRKPNRLSADEGELRHLREHHEEMAARVTGLDTDNIASSSAAASDVLRREEKEKAAQLDRLHFLFKEKLIESSKEAKVQVLTLTPDSWSRERVAQFFNVSERMVCTARKLKKEKGILSKPEAKLANKLPESTISLATEFLQYDEYSRIMPGKRDFASLGHRQHVQQSLLLCILREIYQLLKGKYPDIKIGFSSFCSLQPKWCV